MHDGKSITYQQAIIRRARKAYGGRDVNEAQEATRVRAENARLRKIGCIGNSLNKNPPTILAEEVVFCLCLTSSSDRIPQYKLS